MHLKYLFGLSFIVIMGCQTSQPTMSISSKADSWRMSRVSRQVSFRLDEEPTLRIFGCAGKHVKIDVIEQATGTPVLTGETNLPTRVVRKVDEQYELIKDGYQYRPQTTEYVTMDILQPKFVLGLKRPGAYEAQLTVDQKLVQTLPFTVVNSK